MAFETSGISSFSAAIVPGSMQHGEMEAIERSNVAKPSRIFENNRG